MTRTAPIADGNRRLLQIAPDDVVENVHDEDDILCCIDCGHLITRQRWALSMGGHEHTFANPAGQVFVVRCFVEAPGASRTGNPSDAFSWFRGYQWSFAHCNGCGRQMGWWFEGDGPPRTFAALIAARLRPGTTGDGR